jgi:hypothetical protein
MKRIIRLLRIFTLFAAVASINIHMIIPHDHHLTESVSAQDDSCPASKNEPGHHTGLPVHCHACNDLAFEKAGNVTIVRNVQCKFILSGCIIDNKESELPYTFAKRIDVRASYFDYESVYIALLRAPPSFV